MATLLAGVGGALIGLMGVAIGAWFQSRREHDSGLPGADMIFVCSVGRLA
jgi:hypothetical protein